MTEVRTIDANALKDELKRSQAKAFMNQSWEIAGLIAAIIRMIDEQPTIESEPVRHGRWIPIEYDSYADGAPVWDKYECSECGHEHVGEEDTLTDYCPKCGARMYGGADNG